MSAGRYDIYVEKGATWRKQFTVRYKGGLPIDLTDYIPHMQIRPDFDGPLTLDLTGSTYFPDNDLPNGRFVVYLGADKTVLLAPGRYRYDLELYDSTDATNIFRLVEGRLTVAPEITT